MHSPHMHDKKQKNKKRPHTVEGTDVVGGVYQLLVFDLLIDLEHAAAGKGARQRRWPVSESPGRSNRASIPLISGTPLRTGEEAQTTRRAIGEAGG